MDEIRNEMVIPFTMVPNEILSDPLLSLKHKGMLCYLISLPKGWTIYKSELENHFTDGRESISNAIDDLVKLGFINKEENKKSAGRFAGFTYTVLPLRVNRNGLSATVNPQLINTNISNTDKVNLNINAGLKNPAPKPKTKKVTLITNFTEEQTKELYNLVKNYFMQLYFDKHKTAYYFEPKDGSKVYNLIKKVIFKMKEKQGTDLFSVAQVSDAVNIFIRTAYITADSFITGNFNLSIIDSKFNDIFSKINLGKHGDSIKPNAYTAARDSSQKYSPFNQAK